MIENPKAVELKEIIPNANVEGLVRLVEIEKGRLPAIGEKVETNTEEFSDRHRFCQDFGKAVSSCFALDILQEERLKIYINKFKNQIVVDLGAGETPDGYILALIGGAKAYIGVEPFYADVLIKRLTEKVKDLGEYVDEGPTIIHLINRIRLHKEYGEGLAKDIDLELLDSIPISIVAEDALKFLKRLPDKSVSILTCGTCDIVSKDPQYINEVNQNMKRVLHPYGDCISYMSYWGI
tara:strand:- start:8080 stop:8790 length:711 start_codon:yes stop_codon:yes gene_type:complete